MKCYTSSLNIFEDYITLTFDLSREDLAVKSKTELSQILKKLSVQHCVHKANKTKAQHNNMGLITLCANRNK